MKNQYYQQQNSDNFPIGFAFINNWKDIKQLLQKFVKSGDKIYKQDLKNLLFYQNNNNYNSYNYKNYNYNQNYNQNINNLENLIKKYDKDLFYGSFIKEISQFALNSEEYFKNKEGKFPKLHQNCSLEVSFTRRECASIVSLMFFNLLESSNRNVNKNINMKVLQEGSYNKFNDSNFAKLECFYQYLQQIIGKQSNKKFMEEKITIKRCQNFDLPERNMKNVLSKIKIDDNNSIQYHQDHAQVDFANKYIGGGALGNGSIQEEILFATCPELLASLIFAEKLEDNEALVFKNVNTYTTFTGYSDTFKFDSVVKQFYPKEIIAIDSKNYSQYNQEGQQYKPFNIKREILKAYTGFQNCDSTNIATGNWGCGAFKSDLQLKFVIQWIAASLANKQLTYCTFNKPELSAFKEYQQVIFDQKCKVNQVYNALINLKYVNNQNSVFQQVMDSLLDSNQNKQQRQDFNYENMQKQYDQKCEYQQKRDNYENKQKSQEKFKSQEGGSLLTDLNNFDLNLEDQQLQNQDKKTKKGQNKEQNYHYKENNSNQQYQTTYNKSYNLRSNDKKQDKYNKMEEE